jgi:hypothetical protein
VEAGGRNKKGAGVVREEEGPSGGHHGPRFFAFSGHPRGRATEGEFATNAAGGWGEGHAARNRMTPAHPPLRGCKNSVRMDVASDRARYLLLPRTTVVVVERVNNPWFYYGFVSPGRQDRGFGVGIIQKSTFWTVRRSGYLFGTCKHARIYMLCVIT